MLRTNAILLFLASPWAISAQPASAPGPTITVTGRASVSAKPDQAELIVGISTVGQTAQIAAELNARDSNALQTHLRDSFKTAIDIETTDYSVSPDYEQPQSADPQVPRRYRVNNMIHVNIKDLKDVSKVIDAALSSGANRLQGLNFKVKDSRGLELRALQDAARDARAKATAMAEALGLRITGIRTVSESGGGGRQPVMYRAAAVGNFAPPIEPGTYETEATVTMEVFVAPR